MKLNKQTFLDEKEQAEKRYGIDQPQFVNAYLEGVIDGAKWYELTKDEALKLEKLI